MISFFVPGKPKALKRHRSFRPPNGQPRQVDPSKNDKADFLAIAMQHRPHGAIEVPICLHLVCVFPRPKSHYRTGRNAHVLKDTAPFWHSSAPDWDNVAKFVGDALNGIFWKDDRLIVRGSVESIYGKVPGIHVRIGTPTREEEERVAAVAQS